MLKRILVFLKNGYQSNMTTAMNNSKKSFKKRLEEIVQYKGQKKLLIPVTIIAVAVLIGVSILTSTLFIDKKQFNESVATPIPSINSDIMSNGNNSSESHSAANSGAFICKKDDTLYFSNTNDGGKLYRMDLDLGSKTKLSDYDVKYLNIIGDWLFYYTFDGNKIMKEKTDGSSKDTVETIDPKYTISHMCVVENVIYYSKELKIGDAYSIVKFNIDDKTKTIISQEDGPIFSMNFVNNSIYFVSQSNDNNFVFKICRIEITNNNKKTIYSNIKHHIGDITVIGDWIYYLSWGGIRKIQIDDTNKILLSKNNGDETYWMINVTQDYIFYIGNEKLVEFQNEDLAKDKNGNYIRAPRTYTYSLYRIGLDGKKKITLDDGICYGSPINVVDHWIYYYKETYKHGYVDSNQFWRVDDNGKVKEKVY